MLRMGRVLTGTPIITPTTKGNRAPTQQTQQKTNPEQQLTRTNQLANQDPSSIRAIPARGKQPTKVAAALSQYQSKDGRLIRGQAFCNDKEINLILQNTRYPWHRKFHKFKYPSVSFCPELPPDGKKNS
jgi:hypothetical protein